MDFHIVKAMLTKKGIFFRGQYFTCEKAIREQWFTRSNTQRVLLFDAFYEKNNFEADDVADKVQLKIEKSKIYDHLDILDPREQEVIRGRFGLEHGGEERTQREIVKEHLQILCIPNRETCINEAIS